MAKHPQDSQEAQELKLELKGFISEAQKITEKLDPIVDKYKERNSEFLAGSAGGLGAGTLVLALYGLNYIGAALAAALGAPAVILGIVIMILMFRGPDQWKRERKRKELGSELAFLIKQADAIQNVPGAPDHVKAEIWSAYRDEVSVHRTGIRKEKQPSLSPPESERLLMEVTAFKERGLVDEQDASPQEVGSSLLVSDSATVEESTRRPQSVRE